MIRATALFLVLRRRTGRFFTFAFVGSVGTAIQYTALGIGTMMGSSHPVTGSVVGYALGSVVNYLLNYRFTFQSKAPHSQSATKYFSILAVGWVINLCLMSLFVVSFGWGHWISQVITTTIGLIWNYTGSHHWAFRSATYPCSSAECTASCPPCGSCVGHGSNKWPSTTAPEQADTVNTLILAVSTKRFGIYGRSAGCNDGTVASK